VIKKTFLGLVICSFLFSSSSVKADDDIQKWLDLSKGIIDIATNNGNGWNNGGGNNGGGNGGWNNGGGNNGWNNGGGNNGWVNSAVYTPNGSAVYPGQTIYENGYKYWRCGNPSCYKLHSQYVGGGNNGGGQGGPGVMEFRIGILTRSAGNGVSVTGFTNNYNNGNLQVGDKIVQARLSDGRIVNIRNLNDLNRAKSISGPSGSMQVRVYDPNRGGYVVKKIVIMGEGSGGHAVIDDHWDNNSNGFSP
jgi:hypothetical protein